VPKIVKITNNVTQICCHGYDGFSATPERAK
jgi:hypothetical protein